MGEVCAVYGSSGEQFGTGSAGRRSAELALSSENRMTAGNVSACVIREGPTACADLGPLTGVLGRRRQAVFSCISALRASALWPISVALPPTFVNFAGWIEAAGSDRLAVGHYSLMGADPQHALGRPAAGANDLGTRARHAYQRLPAN